MKFIDFSEQAQQKNFTEPAESKELEYKLSQNKLSKSFWETVSAFANTDGGLIYGSQSKIRQRLNILVESGIINVTGKGRATFYQLLKTPAQKKVEKIMNLWDLEKSLY